MVLVNCDNKTKPFFCLDSLNLCQIKRIQPFLSHTLNILNPGIQSSKFSRTQKRFLWETTVNDLLSGNKSAKFDKEINGCGGSKYIKNHFYVSFFSVAIFSLNLSFNLPAPYTTLKLSIKHQIHQFIFFQEIMAQIHL